VVTVVGAVGCGLHAPPPSPPCHTERDPPHQNQPSNDPPTHRQSAKRVLSQLKRIARAMWSNPPTHGARIAAEVVGDKGMFEEWKGEMAGRTPH